MSLNTAPANCGTSTASEGNLFATITGEAKVKTLAGDRQGSFTISANGFPLGTKNSYNAAVDFCNNLGFTPVDCTQ